MKTLGALANLVSIALLLAIVAFGIGSIAWGVLVGLLHALAPR
jgi:hypothetical protein